MKKLEDEFRFFSLNKKMDWEKSISINLSISDQSIHIDQTEKYGFHKLIRLSEIEGTSDIYDMAVGMKNKLYLLDDKTNLWIYDYENNITERLFRAGHQMFTKRALLAVNGEVIIFADSFAENKISAFSISNGQTLWTLTEWNGKLLYPIAITLDEKKNVYILMPKEASLDENGEPEISEDAVLVIAKINPSGEILEIFTIDACNISVKSKILYLRNRFFIAVSGTGEILLLDTDVREVIRISERGEQRSHMTILTEIQPSGLTIDSHGHFYVSDSRNIGIEGEDNRFIMTFNSLGSFQGMVSGYRGRVDKLVIDMKNRLYILNTEEETITMLELKPRTKMLGATGIQEGILITSSFDSTSSETIWHKVLLDANIPEETQLRISFFSSDRKEMMLGGKYMHLDEYIQDTSTLFNEKVNLLQSIWSKPIINPKDALLFKEQGQYTWLRLEFIGSEHRTPELFSMRLYYPRSSYLSYLPSIYQEDPKSSDFLERFLSLFGTFISEMDENIHLISKYFDIDAVGGEFLKWLGSWLGIAGDEGWSSDQLRSYIKQAPELYKIRGTRKGLEKLVQIYTGEKPIIIEYFQIKHLRNNLELKELISQLYGDNPYSFCVLVKPENVSTEKKRLFLQKMIDEEKPAFTDAKVVVLEPWIYMGTHSYLGINTYLSEPTLLVLDQKSTLPFNTVIIDIDRDNRLGIHTRLELDSELE